MKYDPKRHPKEVKKLTRLGAINTEIAEFFEVSINTIDNWRLKFPKFAEAMRKGKMLADAEVANSLYKRATGASHPETKLFVIDGQIVSEEVRKYYPPDTGAAFIWLKNRQPHLWRDKKEVDVTYNETDAEIEAKILELKNLIDESSPVSEFNEETEN